MEQEYKEAMNAYIKSKKSDGAAMPKEPPMRMLIIPANSSASSLLKILGDNDGIGLLFESEGDTLSQTLKSDYGNYSDVLRKALRGQQSEGVRCTGRNARTGAQVDTRCGERAYEPLLFLHHPLQAWHKECVCYKRYIAIQECHVQNAW